MDQELAVIESMAYAKDTSRPVGVNSSPLESHTDAMMAVFAQSISCHTTYPSCLLSQLQSMAVMELVEKGTTDVAAAIDNAFEIREKEGDSRVGDVIAFFGNDDLHARLLLMRLLKFPSQRDLKPSIAFADWSFGRDTEAMTRLQRENTLLRLQLENIKKQTTAEEGEVKEKVKQEVADTLGRILSTGARKTLTAVTHEGQSEQERKVTGTKALPLEGDPLLEVMNEMTENADYDKWNDLLFLAHIQAHTKQTTTPLSF